MFLNYLLTTLHSLKKRPGISAIKILSLAIGLGCSILVIMHVQYTLSYDKHIPNWERTFRLVTSGTIDRRMDLPGTSDAYAPQMRLDYPQIENIAKIRPDEGIFNRENISITDEFFWAEPDIIDIFSLGFIGGNPGAALNDPNSIVLDETTAGKYFPDGNALGNTLTLEHNANKIDLRVTGVFHDLPENTHIKLPIMVSYETARQKYGEEFIGEDAWVGLRGTMTYLTLPSQADGEAINNDLAAFIMRNIPDEQKRFAELLELELALQPLSDIYLNPRGGDSNRLQVLIVLSLFAFLILISSCINFTNLTISQSNERSREIGIRKTLGATRGQVIFQFLFESLILTFIALAIAAPFIYFSIPVYTNLTRTGFTAATVLGTGTVLLLTVFVILTGFLSGLLPALAKSRQQPVNILKRGNTHKKLSQLTRSVVTVIQFGFSTAVVILAAGVILQVHHLTTMDPGLNMKNLVILNTTYSASGTENFQYDAMLDELKDHPGIVSIARSDFSPPNTGSYNPWSLLSYGPEEFRVLSNIVVDENYFNTMEIKLLAGRTFQQRYSTDFIDRGPSTGESETEQEEAEVRSIIITRFAARHLGFGSPEEAVDEIILRTGGNSRYRVIGVVEDFHQSGGLEDTLMSTAILRATRDPLRILLIRIDPEQAQSALDHIDRVWNRYRPDAPVNRSFFEQIYNNNVLEQTNGIRKASIFASSITLLISIFGLYALAYYTSQRRTKEVGIRKVLGAKSMTIYKILTWDFIKPVLIACIIACIAGYFVINRYIEQFSSRAEISPALYLAVVAGTLLVAVLTVAVQSFKTARSDPVKSLRYE